MLTSGNINSKIAFEL